MGIGSIVSGVVNAVTGGKSGGSSEISGADALARFKGKDAKALESWAKSSPEEFAKYANALGKNAPKDISAALTSSALGFITDNAKELNLEAPSKKNIGLATIRKNIFKQLLQDGFDQMAKIKPLQW